MVSGSIEFRLSLKPSYVPKTLSNLFEDLSKIENLSDRLFVLNDYLHKYQEELSKVEVFKRELPQCMLLLMDAIETLKEEFMNVRDELRSHSSEKPMEFLSVNGGHDEIPHGETCKAEKYVCVSREDIGICKFNHGEKRCKTTLHTSAVQACNVWDGGAATSKLEGSSDVPESNSVEGIKLSVKEVDESLGYGGLNVRVNDQPPNLQSKLLSKPIWRNHRRSWTPELHASFVAALEYLGGPEVATPKKIREVMNFEGLTNDQVKSHLQKYRLSSRRIPVADVERSS